MKISNYEHIEVSTAANPLKYDVVIVPINDFGEVDSKIKDLLNSYGVIFPSIEINNILEKSYLVESRDYIFLYIISVENEYPWITFDINLRKALKRFKSSLVNKTVWLPLMIIGKDFPKPANSYEKIINIIKDFKETKFKISLPYGYSVEKYIKDFNPTPSENNSINNEEIEKPIKGLPQIFYGKKIGIELFNYDVIILPKSGVGGIGQNGIAAKVLEIFGLNRDSFKFDEYHLKTRKYKWFKKVIEDKLFYFGFVITRDENKNKIDFTNQLRKSIKALDEFNDIKGDVINRTNIFIPFLGAGQAGMNYLESLNKILSGVQLLRSVIPFYRIRINFPLNIDQSDEKIFLKHLVNQLSGPPPAPGFYIEQSENFQEDLESEEQSNNTISDKIPFHLDQVVKHDKLGREPVAKAFVNLLKKDVFTDKLNHSFMVHLQGKWGAGKSSFLNFIKKNLNSDIEDWIIVDYNAWQNQHINPPWWSLINQIYLQSRAQFYLIGIRTSLHLWRKETLRRLWRYSGWQKVLSIVFFIIFILCIIYFGSDILQIFKDSAESNPKKSFLSHLGDFGKLILTSVTLLTSLYGFAKFVTFPFFINSSKDAQNFILKANDPMNKVKRHFNDLVDDINSKKKKRQLAIFIDDIDRCDKRNIVQLLEGIQTLFKDKRVLYIVAGDKNWISTSFGNTYEEFASAQVDKKQLGEFFIEKAFQLSFRLPNVSQSAIETYWNYILGFKTDDTKRVNNSVAELNEEEQNRLETELKDSKSQLTNPSFVEEIQDKYNLSNDTASSIVIEEKNKDTEKIRHLLIDYHKYIDTNPRSIIRLANNYTMARSILMAERVAFSEHKLFRWLVIEDLCPTVKYKLQTTDDISGYEKIIMVCQDVTKKNNALLLLKGEEDFMEGEITIEDIKTIKGL